MIVFIEVNVDGRGDAAVSLQFCHIGNSKYWSFLNHCRLSFLEFDWNWKCSVKYIKAPEIYCCSSKNIDVGHFLCNTLNVSFQSRIWNIALGSGTLNRFCSWILYST
jgi:hypothetical protein